MLQCALAKPHADVQCGRRVHAQADESTDALEEELLNAGMAAVAASSASADADPSEETRADAKDVQNVPKVSRVHRRMLLQWCLQWLNHASERTIEASLQAFINTFKVSRAPQRTRRVDEQIQFNR